MTWMQTKIVKGWGYPWPTSSGVYEGFGWGALHKDEEIIITPERHELRPVSHL